MECPGAESGLQLVASARVPPWSTKKPARAKRPSVWKPVQGKMTPKVGDPARPSDRPLTRPRRSALRAWSRIASRGHT